MCQSLRNFALGFRFVRFPKEHRGNEIVAFNYLFDIKKRRKFQDEKV